jgi:hypothetical protein
MLGADGRLVAPVSETDTKSNTGSIAALLDRWIVISSSCADTSELLLDVRRELDAALSFKVMRPRRAVPKASSDIVDAVAATLHIVDARESAALARQRRAESASGAYDRFSNRDGFGDGAFGSRPNRPGFDRPNRPGFGKPRGRAAGRLRRDADGNFVRTPAKGGEQ